VLPQAKQIHGPQQIAQVLGTKKGMQIKVLHRHDSAVTGLVRAFARRLSFVEFHCVLLGVPTHG
jgi:hypothetical protein